MNKERRRYTRVPVAVDVDVSVQIDKKHRGRVTDISEAGLFIEPVIMWRRAIFFVIQFIGEIIMFGATVCRIAANGFGAEFGTMNDVHREVISRYIPMTKQAKVSLIHQTPTIMLLSENRSHAILEHELKAAGFEVLEVRSIDKAISSMERFDVVGVISEYIVGGKETVSILKKIKEWKRPLNFPVIMYSSRYDLPYKRLEELGIQCFIKSNTSPRNLVAHMKMNFTEDYKRYQDANRVLPSASQQVR